MAWNMVQRTMASSLLPALPRTSPAQHSTPSPPPHPPTRGEGQQGGAQRLCIGQVCGPVACDLGVAAEPKPVLS